MKLEEAAKIIEAEASVLPYSGKLGVAQCIADLNYNASAFTKPSDYYSEDSMKAAKAVMENGERRIHDASILQLRSYKNYSDGNGNPDWSKLKSGICPIPDDMEYLGTDYLNNTWGTFYFGKKKSKKIDDKMSNFKMLVIAGHGEGDPGAIGCGYQESDLTRELVKLIKNAADKCGISCDVADTSKNYYKYLKNGGSYNFKPYNYVLEVHFNASETTDYAGNGNMKGSMFFISEWEKGHSVEDAILNELYSIGSCKAWDGVVLSTANYKGGLLVQNRVNQQGVSHGLLETCFISDFDDVKWYQCKKNQIAESIIKGIKKGFKLSGQTNPTPSEIEPKKAVFQPYMVKVDVSKISDHFLNIRAGAGTQYKITGKITETGSYTIIEEENGWGKLKSGAGWINLAYTSKTGF